MHFYRDGILLAASIAPEMLRFGFALCLFWIISELVSCCLTKRILKTSIFQCLKTITMAVDSLLCLGVLRRLWTEFAIMARRRRRWTAEKVVSVVAHSTAMIRTLTRTMFGPFRLSVIRFYNYRGSTNDRRIIRNKSTTSEITIMVIRDVPWVLILLVFEIFVNLILFFRIFFYFCLFNFAIRFDRLIGFSLKLWILFSRQLNRA